MRLIKEIARTLGAEAGVRMQFTVFEGQGGYFQNVRRVEEFSDDAIVLRGGRSSLRVEGRGLSLGKYCGGDVSVRGEILRVEWRERRAETGRGGGGT